MKQELLEKYIKQGVEKEVGIEFDKKMEVLLKELNSRKNEIVCGIVLNIMKTVEFDTIGHTLNIKVKEIKP